MHVEVVVKICLDEVVYETSDSRSLVINDVSVCIFGVLLPHEGRTELGLGLTLEVRLLDLDADGSDNTLTDVLRVIILLEELLQGLYYSLSEGSKVSTSVACILTVHE